MRNYYTFHKNESQKTLLSVRMRNYYALYKTESQKTLLSVVMRNYYTLHKNRTTKKKPMTVWSRLFMGSFFMQFRRNASIIRHQTALKGRKMING